MDDLSHDLSRRLNQLNRKYYAHYGHAIEMMKAEVGAGDRYANTVARVTVSARGAWCECVDMPAEFSGTVGPTQVEFVAGHEAIAILKAVEQAGEQVAPGNTRRLMALALYTPRGIADQNDAYAFDYECAPGTQPSGPMRIGQIRPSQAPLYLRCRIDTDLQIAGLPVRHGVVVYLALEGERHLLLTMPHDGPGIWDIADDDTGAVRQ